MITEVSKSVEVVKWSRIQWEVRPSDDWPTLADWKLRFNALLYSKPGDMRFTSIGKLVVHFHPSSFHEGSIFCSTGLSPRTEKY